MERVPSGYRTPVIIDILKTSSVAQVRIHDTVVFSAHLLVTTHRSSDKGFGRWIAGPEGERY